MEEQNQSLQEGGKNKYKVITIILVVVIIAASAAFFSYLAWKNNSRKQQELAALRAEVENLQKQASELTKNVEENSTPAVETGESGEETESSAAEETQAAADEYAGWNTYTNNDIGYALRYPTDWTVEETDTHSEIIDEDVKYITIHSPGKKYFLFWGIKEKNDDFYISDRTGIGAGEIKKDGTVTILGTENDIMKLVDKGKVKEYFFTWSGGGKTADGKYQFTASLSYGSSSSYESLDMEGLEELEIAKKILGSVKLI